MSAGPPSAPPSSNTAASSLKGRVVLVTGASRGLGRALALEYGRLGARVALCARGAAELGDVAGAVRQAGGRALVVPADVSQPDAGERVVSAVQREWGAVRVLVNNASILGERMPLREHPTALWRAVMDVNLNGAVALSAAVLGGMRSAGDGSIVNVSSGVGNEPRAGWGAYAVSKWALEAFSYNLALEEQPAGVRVNIVDPGRMRTGMRRAAYPDEDPATLPEPTQVTPVFVWLASDASVGVTGRRFEARSWRPPR